MIRVEPHEVLNHLVDETESRLVDDPDIEAFAASTATTGYHARRMFFILGRRATVRVCTSTAGDRRRGGDRRLKTCCRLRCVTDMDLSGHLFERFVQ